jgi:hypothetical protein
MKSNHIKRSKRKHFKQLKRTAKKKKLRIEALALYRKEKEETRIESQNGNN